MLSLSEHSPVSCHGALSVPSGRGCSVTRQEVSCLPGLKVPKARMFISLDVDLGSTQHHVALRVQANGGMYTLSGLEHTDKCCETGRSEQAHLGSRFTEGITGSHFHQLRGG